MGNESFNKLDWYFTNRTFYNRKKLIEVTEVERRMGKKSPGPNDTLEPSISAPEFMQTNVELTKILERRYLFLHKF